MASGEPGTVEGAGVTVGEGVKVGVGGRTVGVEVTARVRATMVASTACAVAVALFGGSSFRFVGEKVQAEVKNSSRSITGRGLRCMQAILP